ncbi:hypothetical protein BU204_13385 [Actinophytocola xanthii]|uniref:PE domain-containing protein n=1 Tax=Actinophytocola xanthii TaxID=1912961 RepID=A0A1Q8CRY6_9PSEU|nr:hypothetical protein BU204_13385 [Actinophytocola xanthii]
MEELGAVIAEWEAVRDGVVADGRKIVQAQSLISSPAGDEMSTAQATAVRDSLTAAREHNERMRLYATDYIEKLTAARDQYRHDDDLNAARMRGVDVD